MLMHLLSRKKKEKMRKIRIKDMKRKKIKILKL
jgi:hypothetical protein